MVKKCTGAQVVTNHLSSTFVEQHVFFSPSSFGGTLPVFKSAVHQKKNP